MHNSKTVEVSPADLKTPLLVLKVYISSTHVPVPPGLWTASPDEPSWTGTPCSGRAWWAATWWTGTLWCRRPSCWRGASAWPGSRAPWRRRRSRLRGASRGVDCNLDLHRTLRGKQYIRNKNIFFLNRCRSIIVNNQLLFFT